MGAGEKKESFWRGSVGRKVWKTALVLVLLTAFAQWYLPYRGYKLAAGVGDPEYKTLSQLLMEERLRLREVLLQNDLEVTHGKMWDNGMRASRKKQSDSRPHRILIIGDSWTFGVGVNDNQSYPWLLGEMFSDCAFDNAGIPSYGPYTVLLSMQEYLPKQHYDMVIYSAITHHLYRDGFFWSHTASPPNAPRSSIYVRSYCGMKGPAGGDTKPRLVPHPGGCLLWPCDHFLYLANFAKQCWVEMYKPIYHRVTSYGKYSRFLNDETLAAMRFRLLLDEMEKYARSQGCSFGFVGLDELNYILNRDKVFSAPDDQNKVDWRASFPVLDASYPVNFREYRELRTQSTQFDDGLHPGPAVHAYYAQTIGDWLARPEVAGSWIGKHSPVSVPTLVKNGKYIGTPKQKKTFNHELLPVRKDTGANDDVQPATNDDEDTVPRWEKVPSGAENKE